MSSLPQVSGSRLINALKKTGFVILRQKGSHVLMRHRDDLSRRATIPVHGSKSIKPGTLRAILRGVQLNEEDLKQLL